MDQTEDIPNLPNSDRYEFWPQERFEQLPRLKWDVSYICDSLVIIPSKGMIHDSGYRTMAVVPIFENKPLGLLGGTTDVIHIEGITGRGERWLDVLQASRQEVMTMVDRELTKTEERIIYETSGMYARPWCVDCLPGSGFFRLFVQDFGIRTGPALSSLEIFSVKVERGVPHE